MSDFRLGGRDVADGREQQAIVDPVDLFQRGVLDRLKRAPGTLPPDHLGLVETVARLCESFVVAVAIKVIQTALARVSADVD